MYYTIRKDKLDQFLTYGYSPTISTSNKEGEVVDRAIQFFLSQEDETPFHLVYTYGTDKTPALLKSYFYVRGEYHCVCNLKAYSDNDYM